MDFVETGRIGGRSAPGQRGIFRLDPVEQRNVLRSLGREQTDSRRLLGNGDAMRIDDLKDEKRGDVRQRRNDDETQGNK